MRVQNRICLDNKQTCSVASFAGLTKKERDLDRTAGLRRGL